MAAAYPSGSNTFVPDHEASGKMVVDFSRNPKDFAVNKYAQLVPVKKVTGYYMKMTVEEAGRILDTDLTAHEWPDGNDAPLGNEGAESFEWLPFMTKRRLFRANIGDLASEQASWDILDQHARIKAQQAMTARTQLVVTASQTAGNYVAAHTATATVTGGGLWPASTTATLHIKKSIDYAINQITQSTLAAVKVDEMILVVAPTMAKDMAESQEIVDYLKGSPHALAYIKGEISEGDQKNRLFGLPQDYAGVKIVVEDAVKVTSKKGATRATSYVADAAKPFICSRPGGLIGVAGAPSFSTITMFVYEKDEMATEKLHDVDNRRTAVRVIDNLQVIVTADISGFLFTSAR